MAEHKKSPLLSLVLFDEAGERYEKIDKVMQEARIPHVFYLKGGLQGYEAFLRRQVLTWHSNDPSRKTSKKCPTCP